LFFEFPEGLLDALGEGDFGIPAEAAGFGRIHYFAWHAIGFAGIPVDFALESSFVGDGFCELTDGDFVSGSDIDDIGVIVVLHEEEDGVGEVIDMEEFAEGGTAAPEGDFGEVLLPGFDKFPDQGGEDMAVLGMVVVIAAIEVAGHQTDRGKCILPGEKLTQLVTGNFGEGISFIGGFEWTGQQGIFTNGLRGLTGINAIGTEKTELLDAGFPSGRNNVVLNLKVLK